MAARNRRRLSRRWVVSLLGSLGLHGLLLGGAALTPAWLPLRLLRARTAASALPHLTLRMETDDGGDDAGSLVVLSSYSDEALDAVTLSPDEIFAAALTVSEPSLEEPPLPAPPVRWETIEEVIEATVRQARALSEEEQLDRLAVLAGRLESVSSTESVDEVTGRLARWLGTGRRAELAEPPPPGPFDFGTAQLHDVLREPGPDDQFRYLAVLVDARGRRMESVMDAADGARAFRVMQLLKQNPLAERVYRAVVMGLLDRALASAPRTGPAVPADVPHDQDDPSRPPEGTARP